MKILHDALFQCIKLKIILDLKFSKIIMQAISGIINDIIVLTIFICLILLINGKVKLKSESRDKLDDLLSSNNKTFANI
jgi:hypothetical protein